MNVLCMFSLDIYLVIFILIRIIILRYPMKEDEVAMEAKSFSFPFEPYPIQVKFMTNLYRTIDESQHGIFESPTGTGKSLSICCGALQWLRDFEEKCIVNLETAINDVKNDLENFKSGENWLEDEYQKISKIKHLNMLIEKQKKLHKAKEDIAIMKQRVLNLSKNISKTTSYIKPLDVQKSNVDMESSYLEEPNLIIDPNNSDSSGEESDSDLKVDEDQRTVIYITSRTHSQLAQMINEIQQTSFKENTKVVTLASRQHYCINEVVSKSKNINLINEKCLDMQKQDKSKTTSQDSDGKVLKKSRKSSCGSCPYYNQSNIEKLKESLLVNIMDVEDTVKAGKVLKACPYYASRAALSHADVVLLTHAAIVSAGARNAMSIVLKNNILIVDEAHGLVSAIEQAHTALLTAKALNNTKTLIAEYKEKYKGMFSSTNLLSLNQLIFILQKLTYVMVEKESKTYIFTLEVFVLRAEIEHLKIKPIIEYCRDKKLPQKLHGFSLWQSNNPQLDNSPKKERKTMKSFLSSLSKSKEAANENLDTAKCECKEKEVESSVGSYLYSILNFLDMLCNRSEDGRILLQTSSNFNGQLKYLLLNPSSQFSPVVEECRSVILAGGTMKPVKEFESLLKAAKNELSKVFCDHVVSSDNILAICLSKGPSNKCLNFSFDNRNSEDLLEETSRAIRNICNVTPGGVICFLPSYSYEKLLHDHMKSKGTLEAISKKKIVFREPKNSNEVENLLKEYSCAVKSRSKGNNGALLLSVVGGKLSEGLNFNDDLGRCVIVVGLPYPNIKSLELQEKMNYLNKTIGPGEGNSYYESLCIKAVNQCIGRAIRHINDYACMILLDERFSKPNIATALPSFVQNSLHTNMNFPATLGAVAKFFNKKKTM